MTKLAEQLTAFLALVTRPDHPPEPIASNFSVVPANDNIALAKAERMPTEKLLKITPSIEEIQRSVIGAWVWGDQEFDGKTDPVTNEPIPLASTGPLKSIGKLHFSDGKKTEKALMRGPDGDVIQYDRRMPRGAMLGTTESLTEDAGGATASITIGNATLCERMGVAPHDYIPGRSRRRGKSYTADESKELIAKAVANTHEMPPVTVCPPGLASGTAQFSDQFIGMKIGSTGGGNGGQAHWTDLYVAGEEHAAERRAFEEISLSDKSVFAAAASAGSFADISPGGSKQGAIKRGKRLLLAANDNLALNMQKFGS